MSPKQKKIKSVGGDTKAPKLKSSVEPNFHWNKESELIVWIKKSLQHIYKSVTLQLF